MPRSTPSPRTLVNAATKGDAPAALSIVRSGVSVNCTITNGYIENFTPLMAASSAAQPRIVDMLLANSADVAMKTQSISGGAGDLTALHFALLPAKKTDSYLAVIKSLLAAGSNPDAPSNNGSTPLSEAASAGWKEVVELFLSSGAQSHRVPARVTPLHAAAFNGRTEILKLLLDHDAPVDLRDADGLTPLMAAIQSGHEEMCDLLLSRGADAKATDGLGRTTLIHAALFARDAEDDDHQTALRIIERLLKLGVPPKTRDSQNKTAYDYAKAGYEPHAARYLKSRL